MLNGELLEHALFVARRVLQVAVINCNVSALRLYRGNVIIIIFMLIKISRIAIESPTLCFDKLFSTCLKCQEKCDDKREGENR